EVVTAQCDNGKGSSHLVNVVLNGRKLAVDAAPNSAVQVPGLVSLVLNKQVRDAHGNLRVTAIELSLKLGTAVETVSISSATCSGGSEEPSTPGNPNPSPAPSTPPGEAPAPTPVTGDLPVTG